MSAPPPQAVLVGAGLAWNYARSRAGHPTISRWACEHKAVALTVAGGFSAWWLTHWALYVIEVGE
jgi:hypothetical protein